MEKGALATERPFALWVVGMFRCFLRILICALVCAAPVHAEPVGVSAHPFPLVDEGYAPTDRIGKLRFLGGVNLESSGRRFGGWSGLHLDPDLRMTVVADRGRWMQAYRQLDDDGRLTGLRTADWGWLNDGSGRPLQSSRLQDAESLARLPDGTWLVGFERWHRIRAYRDMRSAAAYVQSPPGLEDAPYNGGLEALAAFSNGNVLAIAERLEPQDNDAARRAWMRVRNRWISGTYLPQDPYEPSDATALPDGSALVLERRFSLWSGMGNRIVHIPAEVLANPQQNFVWRGEEIARIEKPFPTENYEGISAVRDARGRLLVLLISDDNMNGLQQTKLMLFALENQ